LFAALYHPDVIGTKTGVWRHVPHSRVIVFHETLYTACYLKIFNEFVDQLDDDELQNGYFQQAGATCHTSNESMIEIESIKSNPINV
jgi:hypothetical protein